MSSGELWEWRWRARANVGRGRCVTCVPATDVAAERGDLAEHQEVVARPPAEWRSSMPAAALNGLATLRATVVV